MTEVVAALIWDHDRFLICQRPAHKARGMMWEFVGGKVEPGETKTAALIRECKEELDVEITVHDTFMELIHIYPDITIHLTLFNASIQAGIPKRIEHNDLKWILPDEIALYRFCPADADILKKIRLHCKLFSKQDLSYQSFCKKLIPNISPEKIIGVRTPELRRIKKMAAGECAVLLEDSLPHKYYEENLIHGFLISEEPEYEAAIEMLEKFLPYIDNWAVCDGISPRCFRDHPDDLMERIEKWMHSDHAYTVRFGIGMLLKYYLDNEFSEKHLSMVAAVRFDEYYVKMMVAWYFATALAKQYEYTLPYLIQHKLDIWTHNITIRKALESNRITQEQKEYLRTLKYKQAGI